VLRSFLEPSDSRLWRILGLLRRRVPAPGKIAEVLLLEVVGGAADDGGDFGAEELDRPLHGLMLCCRATIAAESERLTE